MPSLARKQLPVPNASAGAEETHIKLNSTHWPPDFMTSVPIHQWCIRKATRGSVEEGAAAHAQSTPSHALTATLLEVSERNVGVAECVVRGLVGTARAEQLLGNVALGQHRQVVRLELGGAPIEELCASRLGGKDVVTSQRRHVGANPGDLQERNEGARMRTDDERGSACNGWGGRAGCVPRTACRACS